MNTISISTRVPQRITHRTAQHTIRYCMVTDLHRVYHVIHFQQPCMQILSP